MHQLRRAICCFVFLAIAAPTAVKAEAPEGNWKLSYLPVPTVEFNTLLVKLEDKDGKLTASRIGDTPTGGMTVEKAAVEGNKLQIDLKSGSGAIVFEGVLSDKEPKKIRGTLGIGSRLYLAELNVTDLEKLERSNSQVRRTLPEPMQKAQTLSLKGRTLESQARQAKDPEEKAKLLKDAKEATAQAEKEALALYQEVLAKHADDPAVFDAGISLLSRAAKDKSTIAQVESWTKTMDQAAASYGPRWSNEITARTADALLNQDGFGSLALTYARKAKDALGKDASASQQVKVLKTLAVAERKAGKTEDAAKTTASIAKLEEVLDKEYYKTMPPLEAEKFAGRKGKSDRRVVMELFTGAQCPPCVAADVAFDALLHAYKPSDLILIQYHMHIPGPDPLTNADSEARWDYYRKEFPEGVRGTPTTIFNGKPEAGGGGGFANAGNKLEQYRKIIDPLLEEEPNAKVTAHASRKGNTIDIAVEVADLKDPGENKKLKLLLVEDTIRYVGGNNLRFHHHVVRAFPGGVDGLALASNSTKHTATVDLEQLRSTLTAYLDNYAAEKRAFPSPDRPLDFKNLRLIAFVQDDKTKEILQGTLVEIASDSAKSE